MVQDCLLLTLLPFNDSNPQLIVIIDVPIHHVRDLIQTQAGAKLIYLPPNSPDLYPVEQVFSKGKSKREQCSISSLHEPRVLLSMSFSQISEQDWQSLILSNNMVTCSYCKANNIIAIMVRVIHCI